MVLYSVVEHLDLDWPMGSLCLSRAVLELSKSRLVFCKDLIKLRKKFIGNFEKMQFGSSERPI
jgi:hypothetical protein